MRNFNPFDFERPVKDPKLFAGRQEEQDEINYYLDLMLTDNPTYHNLSIIGERAAGKTSFLNMVKYMAENKGLLAVKISLNNETSDNEVFFFKDLFDAIIVSGVEKGMFGGMSGKIYQLYRKAIDMLEIEAEIPFHFGTAYIGAKKNNTNTISQHVILSDLKKLLKEAKEKSILGIVILFDECDLLSANQTLLQKLRNVFSEIDGYVLIFTGTEKMFPAMTETFSPIPRIFKRIDIKNFKTVEETKECILRRLSEDEKKLINDGTIAEIHQMTNGSPYEVQLVSHFMYKKFMEQNNTNIVINTSVLDDVTNELERLRLGGHHSIANKIKKCYPDQMKVLQAILEFPNTTIDQLSRFLVLSEIKNMDIGNLSNTLSTYRLTIDQLIGKIIIQENDKLRFAGDQFDTLYLKYHLLSNGMTNFMIGDPAEPDLNLHQKFAGLLVDGIESYRNYTAFDEPFSETKQSGGKGQKITFGGKFKTSPQVKAGEKQLLFSFTPNESQRDFYLGKEKSIRFRVNFNFIKSGFVTQFLFDNDEDLQKLQNRLNELKTKLEFLGIEISSKDEIQITLEGIEKLKQQQYDEAFSKFDEAIKINPSYELAWANKGNAYFVMSKYEDALLCYKEWTKLRPTLPMALEAVGKCFIHLGKFQEAYDYLDKASKLGPESWSIWDNRGRALYRLDKFDEAIRSFNKAVELKNDDYDAIYFKALCNSSLHQIDDAISDYDIVISNTQNDEAIVNKVITLVNNGRENEALNTLDEFVNKFEDNLQILNLKVVIFDKLGKNQEAVECCTKILTKSPNDAITLFNRACYRNRISDTDGALDDLEKAFLISKDVIKELAKTDTDLSTLQNNERFTSLLMKHQ